MSRGKGTMCEVIDGIRKGRRASVAHKQEKAITDAGKVHVFYYDENFKPLLSDGRHENSLIDPKKLKMCGFYD